MIFVGTIFIDADACSVKNETYKVAIRYGWSARAAVRDLPRIAFELVPPPDL
jgi:uncharacterized protein YaiI (UPF0178 family)